MNRQEVIKNIKNSAKEIYSYHGLDTNIKNVIYLDICKGVIGEDYTRDLNLDLCSDNELVALNSEVEEIKKHIPKVILKSNLNGLDMNEIYSVESGFADNIRHFDHHGKYSDFKSPCNNINIPELNINSEIYISHLDADTFCGLKRLYGKQLSNKLDYKLMEQIDLNGSSICSDKYNETLLYMIGINTIMRELKFPRVSHDKQDVTNIIKDMFNMSDKYIILKGKETQDKSEKAYKDCLIDKYDNVILFSADAEDALDPSRAYDDKFNVVIVYRNNWKTISIYCNPKSSYHFAGETIEGILFVGHPQACGSPRGEEFMLKDAKRVFENIIAKCSK